MPSRAFRRQRSARPPCSGSLRIRESREQVDFHGLSLFVIGREALLRNKRASGRKKDLVDVALLEATPEPDET
jgi:hypothetical protein